MTDRSEDEAGRRISLIERFAAAIGIVPPAGAVTPPVRRADGTLSAYPPFERWDDWEELDAERKPRHYSLVPTTCFNCEAGCGLLAFVDRETGAIAKIEGNPLHPGSRGRNCAKGPATLNQVNDPERILYPMRQRGERGSGDWVRVSWEEALDDIGGRIRDALRSGRGNEVMYHVGRPGHEGIMERLLAAWGIDGYNSHTNICSASARLGYLLTNGSDRPSPDYENARLILLFSSHLESGHYFNPHAQRIIDARNRGARLVVVDPRLSNSAASADLWLAPKPGTESALLLAVVLLLIKGDHVNHAFVRDWVDWRGFLRHRHPRDPLEYPRFLARLAECYARFTPEYAAAETGLEAADIRRLAADVAHAGTRIAAHIWRGTASGNKWGWQVARALALITALTGATGARGGTSPHGWHKYKPHYWLTPPPGRSWNELQWPREYPLSTYEMCFLLPHFLLDDRARLAVYFTRVYNPVWTHPDGFHWIQALADRERVGLHVALTPTWNETAYFADYVLPMGHSTERHDLQSQETHAGVWVSFRQPVRRVLAERRGEAPRSTLGTNPGEVWEEDEFWIDLTWRIDPEGALGIRKYYESPYRAGEKLTVDEYYRWIFENAVPGLPEAARDEGLTPLEYMRRIGSFEIRRDVYELHRQVVEAKGAEPPRTDPATGIVSEGERVLGIEVDGKIRQGFATPSRRLEIHSETLAEWGFAEHAIPTYAPSHVDPATLDPARGEYLLIATYRLPTMIHTRSGNAKWLNEISHANPVLIHPDDAARHGLESGALVRVTTPIGWFVNRALVTDGIRPGVLACSHHMGRWRLENGPGSRWHSATVRFENLDRDTRRLRIVQGNESFSSPDPDSGRIWWKESGVNQNLAFPVQPDPASGMHCWHQRVRLGPACDGDRYGDVVVNLKQAREHYRAWLAESRAARGPLRRPLWFPRPLKPAESAYHIG
ncbi:MAG: molybdopterin-dependent oxidoreductase [Planctomycetes bacterium]|nr:molybdopterin-dependent oxidoreductase [Planctomycetota bacterium]